MSSNNPRKTPQPSTSESIVHPEMQRPKRGNVPGNESTKASPGTREDARTGHDKDGNAQQVKPERPVRDPK